MPRGRQLFPDHSQLKKRTSTSLVLINYIRFSAKFVKNHRLHLWRWKMTMPSCSSGLKVSLVRVTRLGYRAVGRPPNSSSANCIESSTFSTATSANMAWRNIKNLNQILHFWNLWVKGFQMVYRLSKSVDILEEALRNNYEISDS